MVACNLLLVLVAGLFLYLQSADLSVYEKQIEGALSDAIGHKVRLRWQV